MSIEGTENKESNSDEVKQLVEQASADIEKLQATIADRVVEIESLQALALEQEESFKQEVARVTAEKDELAKALEVSNTELAAVQKELKDIKEKALLEKRVQSLKSENLLRKTEEAQLKQLEKITAMSDEQFEDYVTDLKDIRDQALGTASSAAASAAESSEKASDAQAIEHAVESTESPSEAVKAKLKEVLANLNPTETEEQTATASEENVEKQVPQKESASRKAAVTADAFAAILQRKNNR